MTINSLILNPIIKKLKSEVKDGSGCEIDLAFNDPVTLNIKDGMVRLHVNVDAAIDGDLLLKLIEEIKE